ncbi:unnamed protein product [Rhodiola kirilowii]
MAGKGRRRREKNYRAAHGGANILPPPPKASSVDALPSKLRQLMSLASETGKFLKVDVEQGKKKKEEKKREEKPTLNDEKKPASDDNTNTGLDEDEFDEEKFNEGQNLDHDNSSDKKKKKKRKRNQVNDLRFEEETAKMLGIGSKRKERKKKYLEEKKKKKKAKIENNQELHRHEKVAFGDVVEAPPKLSVPKAFKSARDASKERLRLKAVDEYRQRKGWVSRPGINLPPPVTSVIS